MCHQDKLYKKTIAYCSYCLSPIYEVDDYIVVNGFYYHYSKDNKLENCYFVEENE